MIHETASISPGVEIGANTQVWHCANIRDGTRIGANCIIGMNVYIDRDVTIGDNVKVHNNTSLGRPMIIEDGVYIGANVVCANDASPRAVNPDGSLKTDTDWTPRQTHLCYGASVGSNAVVLPGLTIGRWALVEVGSVVTRDVPERAIVVGIPARIVGRACDCGGMLHDSETVSRCFICSREYLLARSAPSP